MDIFYTLIEENPDKKEHHNYQHQIGRKLVNYVAENIYKIENTELEVVNNKPKFKYSDKQFNISHSKNVVLAVFDDYPIGVDIQYMRECDYIAVAKRMNLKPENNTKEAFYKVWTQYEALYKSGKKEYKLKTQRFLNDYMLSIASISDLKNINFIKIIFKK